MHKIIIFVYLFFFVLTLSIDSVFTNIQQNTSLFFRFFNVKPRSFFLFVYKYFRNVSKSNFSLSKNRILANGHNTVSIEIDVFFLFVNVLEKVAASAVDEK